MTEQERALDLVFVCDTTGSMGAYLSAAQKGIEHIITSINQSEKCDVQFALVEYRDHPPEDSSFATRLTDFTSSIKEIKTAVSQMSPNGGGDGPESVTCALDVASRLNYRKESSKVIVWIADAPPHGFSKSGDGFPNGCPCNIEFFDVIRRCQKNGLVIYSVAAEPLGFSYLRTLMRAVSELTHGQYASLSGADVLADLIINGAIEEIQIQNLMKEILDELNKDEAFNDLPKEIKLARAKEMIKQKKNTTIKTLKIDTIFKEQLPKVPKCFLEATSLKSLKMEKEKEPDIKVTFKDGFYGNEYSEEYEEDEEDDCFCEDKTEKKRVAKMESKTTKAPEQKVYAEEQMLDEEQEERMYGGFGDLF
ncbi:hypothetical protein EIN_502790 [Entamoeba invadens IP1]|uniref:VWFA domain-containing protein n=1 Tax=Entamoeba invadens IP1 TaxID=370355 RepID=L7FKU2_ENTIV|nr:hypothetical protein EIN_502790 [Entamoeba invadens IP1]ELP86207.1 hypothetical protein EIN_502790 [Entamoeba invadens IP1]|eukprot:XP_004185553.1 hypothetical protein EIN_502790 [Entamoeba invadens IP1]